MFVIFLSDIRVRKRDHELGPHYRPSIVPCQESRAGLSVAHDRSGLRAARVGDHARRGFLPEGRDGAGNESTGRDLAGAGEEVTWWQAAEILGISDIERIFSLQFERAVNRNNRVSFQNLAVETWLHQPSIRSLTSDHDSLFRLHDCSWRQGGQ
jgi:hypothetical protein